jgi:hypothetical protein
VILKLNKWVTSNTVACYLILITWVTLILVGHIWHVICAILQYYAAYSDNSIPTFRYNLSVSSSRFKKSIILYRRFGKLIGPVFKGQEVKNNSVPTFRKNLSVPSSRVRKSRIILYRRFGKNLSVPSSRVKKSRIILYRRFGTTYPSHLQASRSQEVFLHLEDGADRSPETSVQNYHSTLRNIPQEHRFRILVHHGWSLKSRIIRHVLKGNLFWWRKYGSEVFKLCVRPDVKLSGLGVAFQGRGITTVKWVNVCCAM